MMAEEGRSRKQHAFSLIPRLEVGKELSRGTTNIIRVPSFMDSPSSLKGAISYSVLGKMKNNTFTLLIPTKTP